MECRENLALSGTVEILVLEGDVVVESRTIKNLIVDVGKDYFAQKSTDPLFSPLIRQIALGKGVIPPVSTDTNLGNPFVSPTDVNDVSLAISPVTRSHPAIKIAKFTAEFPPGVGSLTTTSANISELVLIFDTSDRTYTSGTMLSFTADGGLFARICGNFAPFAKSSAQTVRVSWYTQTEYAFNTSDCCTDCRRRPVTLTDGTVVPIDLTQGEIFELHTTGVDPITFLLPTPSPPDGEIFELRIRSDSSKYVYWPVNVIGYLYPLPEILEGSPLIRSYFFEFNMEEDRWRCIGKDENSIVIGHNSSISFSAPSTFPSIPNPSDFVIIGSHNHAVTSGSTSRMLVIGSTCGSTAQDSVTIGQACSVGGGYLSPGYASVTIGNIISVGGGTSVSIGSEILAYGTIGSTLSNISIGNLITIGSIADDANENISIGFGNTTVGNNNVSIGIDCIIGSSSNPSSNCIAIGNGASVVGNRTNSQAYGTNALASGNNQVKFGSVTGGINEFEVTSNLAGNPALFFFGAGNIVMNHESAFYLLYKNSLGNIVSMQVKVDPVTGALTVPL